MPLQCGIVGLPNVGKSTLFNALSNTKAIAANFPFCTIEPNIGLVSVPDERLTTLAKLVNPAKTIPTTIEFVDIAGLVKGASQGEGLGNKFLNHIRTIDAIIHVIRCFDDDQIVHVAGKVDPVFDKEIIDYELQQKDLENLHKRLIKIEKLAKTGDKEAKKTVTLLQVFVQALQQGKNARNIQIEETDLPTVQSWQLLTAKPIIYIANVDEKTIQQGNNQYVEQLKKNVQQESAQVILLSAHIEAQIADLPKEEKKIFLKEYGIARAGLDHLIQTAYHLLNLITYFTAGEQEVRAWTIPLGTKAPQAAGVIHSDFEKKFIKAEVIKLIDYQQYKTVLSCKEAGKVAIEGKNYTVIDGDIIHFKI